MIDLQKDSLINLALTEFRDWAGPAQYDKLLQALRTHTHRRRGTRLHYDLKMFSKKLGEIPKEQLGLVIDTLDPETIVEKIPVQKDELKIESIALVDNIDGKSYYEAIARSEKTGDVPVRLYCHDGEFVDGDFAADRQTEGSSFTYGEAHVAEDGDKKYVVYKEINGRPYDEISHLIDFNNRKIAYIGKSGDDLFFIIDDKDRFGQFEYSVYTSQVFKDHAKGLSKKGTQKIEVLLKKIDPLVAERTNRIVNMLEGFRDEFLNPRQSEELDKIIHSYYHVVKQAPKPKPRK
ncbi:MAG: hypothetical protein GY866_28180 [Proteobacteria bacterium]|nr:hypothetical protein [Pseudomonadota bacterium]